MEFSFRVLGGRVWIPVEPVAWKWSAKVQCRCSVHRCQRGNPCPFWPGRPAEHRINGTKKASGSGQPEDAAPSPVTANQSDRRLQTAESSEGLERRLLTAHRLANSTIEETGANTPSIALGMLCWYESDQSAEEPRSPLILVPVRLERDGVRENFRVLFTGEDIGATSPLSKKPAPISACSFRNGMWWNWWRTKQ